MISLVTIHIGNPDDITYRARHILESCDAFVVETPKVFFAMLNELGIDRKERKVWVYAKNPDIGTLDEILEYAKSHHIAEVSDAGMPVIADPGNEIIKRSISLGIDIEPVPGPNSIISGLVMSGFQLKSFRFVGFLSRNNEERKQSLLAMRKFTDTMILLEAPQRLEALLHSIEDVIPERNLALVFDISTSNEEVLRGNSSQVLDFIRKSDWKKREFVVIIEGYIETKKNSFHEDNTFPFPNAHGNTQKVQRYPGRNRFERTSNTNRKIRKK